jgi:hypothetical protein
MSWPIAIFASITVLIVSIFSFLLVIYFKEYAREEKLIKQFGAMKEKELLGTVPVYLTTPSSPKKQKLTQEPKNPFYHKLDKNKKNIN